MKRTKRNGWAVLQVVFFCTTFSDIFLPLFLYSTSSRPLIYSSTCADKFTFMTKRIKRYSIVRVLSPMIANYCSTFFYCITKYHLGVNVRCFSSEDFSLHENLISPRTKQFFFSLQLKLHVAIVYINFTTVNRGVIWGLETTIELIFKHPFKVIKHYVLIAVRVIKMHSQHPSQP